MVLAVGVVLGFLLKLFVFTAYLNPEEIGLLTVLLDSANLFAAFIPLGSQQIFIKFFPFFQDKPDSQPKGLLFLGVFISIIGFLTFTIFYFIFREPILTYYSDKVPLFAKYIQLLIPLIIFRIIFTLGQAYARALKFNVFPLVIKEIIVRILTGIIVILYAQNLFDLNALTVLYASIYFTSGTIMTIYLKKIKILQNGMLIPNFERVTKRNIFEFGIFATLTGAGAIIVRNVDSLMITPMKGLEATGIYAISFFIGQVIEIPRRAVSQITAPFIAESSANKNYQKIQILYRKTSVNQLLIGGLILIIIWFNYDQFMQIIPNGKTFADGKYVVLFIGLGKWIDMAMGVNGDIIQQSSYYKFNLPIMLTLGVVAVINNLIFIPIYGITGAAIASFLSFLFINIIKTLYIWIKLKIHPFQFNTFTAFLNLLIISIIITLIPETGYNIIDIIIKTLTSVIIFVLLLKWLKSSSDLLQFANSFLKKMRIK